jgi:hypothetical protein
MNSFTRRDLAAFSGLTGLLASCSGMTTAQIDAQILADAQGLDSASGALMSAFTQYDPNAISPALQAKINGAAAAASAALTSLQNDATIAAGTGKLQTIDIYINDVLKAIGAALPVASVLFPVLLPFVPMYDAGVALLTGVVEPYLNTILTPPVVAKPAVAYRVKAHYSPQQARSVLGIPNLNTKWS